MMKKHHYMRKSQDLLYNKSKFFFFRIKHMGSHSSISLSFFFFLVMGEIALLLLSVFFQTFFLESVVRVLFIKLWLI